MPGRYTEYIRDGYRLSVSDESMWIECERDDFDVYNVFAISSDGTRWDICIDYKGRGMMYRCETVDHIKSYRADFADVIDLIEIWEELCADRAYMIEHGLAASRHNDNRADKGV